MTITCDYDMVRTNVQANVPAMLVTSGYVANPARRKCSGCGEIKPLSDFAKNKKLRLGVTLYRESLAIAKNT